MHSNGEAAPRHRQNVVGAQSICTNSRFAFRRRMMSNRDTSYTAAGTPVTPRTNMVGRATAWMVVSSVKPIPSARSVAAGAPPTGIDTTPVAGDVRWSRKAGGVRRIASHISLQHVSYCQPSRLQPRRRSDVIDALLSASDLAPTSDRVRDLRRHTALHL
jgi:hypothetical protein